jgi:hypothetical protein
LVGASRSKERPNQRMQLTRARSSRPSVRSPGGERRPCRVGLQVYLGETDGPRGVAACAVEALSSRSNHEDDGGVADRPRKVQVCA